MSLINFCEFVLIYFLKEKTLGTFLTPVRSSGLTGLARLTCFLIAFLNALDIKIWTCGFSGDDSAEPRALSWDCESCGVNTDLDPEVIRANLNERVK